MKLSIVIPCYNESKNIPLIFSRFSEVIKRNDIEVIFVDNGSSDDSDAVLKQLLPNYRFAKSVKVEVNQGYGFGILTGLEAASGDYIGWTHADMQTDPYDVIRALEIIEKSPNKNIYVKGNRRKRPFMDQFFTIGMSFYESVYLGEKLWDINAQPNIFPKDFYSSWSKPPHDFSLDLFALYMAQKSDLKIKRFDVFFPERMHGSSSWNTGFEAKKKFIKRTLEFSKKLKKRLQ